MKQNFFHRYLSAKVLPIWTILLIDVFIIVISSMLAYALYLLSSHPACSLTRFVTIFAAFSWIRRQ